LNVNIVIQIPHRLWHLRLTTGLLNHYRSGALPPTYKATYKVGRPLLKSSNLIGSTNSLIYNEVCAFIHPVL